MELALALLAMAVLQQPSPEAADPSPAPPHHYLRGADPAAGCGARREDGEIVVCGRAEADEQFRMRPIPNAAKYDPRPLRAAMGVLGNAKLGIRNQAAEVGGVASNRAMVTLSISY